MEERFSLRLALTESMTSLASSSLYGAESLRDMYALLLRRADPVTDGGRCCLVRPEGLVESGTGFREGVCGGGPCRGTGGLSLYLELYSAAVGLADDIKPSCESWLPQEYGEDSICRDRSIFSGGGVSIDRSPKYDFVKFLDAGDIAS